MFFAGTLHVLGQGRRQVKVVEGACIAVPAHPAERVEFFGRAGMSGASPQAGGSEGYCGCRWSSNPRDLSRCVDLSLNARELQTCAVRVSFWHRVACGRQRRRLWAKQCHCFSSAGVREVFGPKA